MADVINRTASTRGTFRFIRSVNTPDFDPAIWLINPDLRTVRGAGVPERHWKVVADTVVEMSAAEKAAVDAPIPSPDRDSGRAKLVTLGLTDRELDALGLN